MKDIFIHNKDANKSNELLPYFWITDVSSAENSSISLDLRNRLTEFRRGVDNLFVNIDSRVTSKDYGNIKSKETPPITKFILSVLAFLLVGVVLGILASKLGITPFIPDSAKRLLDSLKYCRQIQIAPSVYSYTSLNGDAVYLDSLKTKDGFYIVKINKMMVKRKIDGSDSINTWGKSIALIDGLVYPGQNVNSINHNQDLSIYVFKNKDNYRQIGPDSFSITHRLDNQMLQNLGLDSIVIHASTKDTNQIKAFLY